MIVVIFEQPKQQKSGNIVTVLGNVILVIFEQFWNIYTGNKPVKLPIYTVVIAEQPENKP